MTIRMAMRVTVSAGWPCGVTVCGGRPAWNLSQRSSVFADRGHSARPAAGGSVACVGSFCPHTSAALSGCSPRPGVHPHAGPCALTLSPSSSRPCPQVPAVLAAPLPVPPCSETSGVFPGAALSWPFPAQVLSGSPPAGGEVRFLSHGQPQPVSRCFRSLSRP